MNSRPIVKRLMREKTPDVLHTSGFATVQGKTFGVDSTESFAKRRAIDANRTTVRRYADSKIAAGTRNANLRAKKYDPRADKSNINHDRVRGQKTAGNRHEARTSVRTGAEKAYMTHAHTMEHRHVSVPRRNPGIFR